MIFIFHQHSVVSESIRLHSCKYKAAFMPTGAVNTRQFSILLQNVSIKRYFKSKIPSKYLALLSAVAIGEKKEPQFSRPFVGTYVAILPFSMLV